MLEWERDDLVQTWVACSASASRTYRSGCSGTYCSCTTTDGRRVGEAIGLSSGDVRHLEPLPAQMLTGEDKQRLRNLGRNGDTIDPTAWGQWTSSVENRQATAEKALGGAVGTPNPVA